MNKKAFSLVEILAVIVILAIISTMTVTNVINHIADARTASYATLVKSITDATELYLSEHSGEYPQLDVPGSTFNIELNDLVKDDYIEPKVIDSRTGEAILLTTTITITVIDNSRINVTFNN
ncbi:MAG: prepilin-type N-terminal cleavage/methylation domain-containing protein [Bacilli bacterium]|jgi:prepilin-type N-terminal cleavage/methylation domain-containing protein